MEYHRAHTHICYLKNFPPKWGDQYHYTGPPRAHHPPRRAARAPHLPPARTNSPTVTLLTSPEPAGRCVFDLSVSGGSGGSQVASSTRNGFVSIRTLGSRTHRTRIPNAHSSRDSPQNAPNAGFERRAARTQARTQAQTQPSLTTRDRERTKRTTRTQVHERWVRKRTNAPNAGSGATWGIISPLKGR